MEERITTLSTEYATFILPHHVLIEYLRQFDPIDREGLEPPNVSTDKNGEYQCKKHGSASRLFNHAAICRLHFTLS
jgi:hypothetical protein